MNQSSSEHITTIKFRDGKNGDFDEERRGQLNEEGNEKEPKNYIDIQFTTAMRVVREINEKLTGEEMICTPSIPEDADAPGVDCLQFRKNVLIIVKEWINRFRSDITAMFQEKSDGTLCQLKVIRLPQAN